MKELLDDLADHPFHRVHKSFAVNKNKIRNFTREKIVIGLFEVPVGRTYYDTLKQFS
jgi:DNA-binding LytR/AlgR family response regulator